MGTAVEHVRRLHENLAARVRDGICTRAQALNEVRAFRYDFLDFIDSSTPAAIEAAAAVEMDFGSPTMSDQLLNHKAYARNKRALERYAAAVRDPLAMTEDDEEILYEAYNNGLLEADTMDVRVLGEMNARAYVEQALVVNDVNNMRPNTLWWGRIQGLYSQETITARVATGWENMERRLLAYTRRGDGYTVEELVEFTGGDLSLSEITEAVREGERAQVRERVEDTVAVVRCLASMLHKR